MGVRSLPFFKAKKGPQFAGGGLDIGGGGGGGSYTLPTATADRLGGVKIGSGVDVAQDGTISNGLNFTISDNEVKTGIKFGSSDVYCRRYVFDSAKTINSDTYTSIVENTNMKELLFVQLLAKFDENATVGSVIRGCSNCRVNASTHALDVMWMGYQTTTIWGAIVFYTKRS